MTQHIDLIIHAKWIIPVIPQNTVFTDCSIAINKGEIVAIKPTTSINDSYKATDETALNHHILMPGLINAHGHAAMSLLRGYADDLPLDTWLNEHIWPTEAKYVSDTFVSDGAELAISEMIKTGTTCFSDMYFFPEETANATHKAGLRCQITFPVLEFPSAWANDANEYINKGLALRDNYRTHPLINVIFGPHAPYTVSDSSFERLAILAPEIQAGIHVHLHETAGEVSNAINDSGKRPIKRLNELGVLTPTTQCVHMTQLIDEDIEILKKTGAHVIHCPESNLKLASGFCPVDQLLKEGINVALGTDGAASNNNLDMFGEMHTAALLAKAVAQDASALNAHEVITMATLNGARAMGIDELVGSLEIGKQADMIAVEIDDLEQAPLHDIASTIVYTHNGHRVTHSWVNGKPLMQDKHLLTINTREVISKAKQWQQQLKSE